MLCAPCIFILSASSLRPVFRGRPEHPRQWGRPCAAVWHLCLVETSSFHRFRMHFPQTQPRLPTPGLLQWKYGPHASEGRHSKIRNPQPGAGTWLAVPFTGAAAVIRARLCGCSVPTAPTPPASVEVSSPTVVSSPIYFWCRYFPCFLVLHRFTIFGSILSIISARLRPREVSHVSSSCLIDCKS